MRRRAVIGAIGAATAMVAGRWLFTPSRPRGKTIGRFVPGEVLSAEEQEIVLATIDYVLLNEVDRPVLVWPRLGGWEPSYIPSADTLASMPELDCCGLKSVDLTATWQAGRPPGKPLDDLRLPENCGWMAYKSEGHDNGLAQVTLWSPLFLDDGRVLAGFGRSYGPLFGGESAVLFERSSKGWVAVDREITGIY